MEQKQTMQEKKSKQIKKQRKNLLHYLLIYLVCLLAACITWLLVRYSMRVGAPEDVGNEASLALCATESAPALEDVFYV